MKQFYGKPGLALTYTLNGKAQTIKGGLGSPARIMINGSESDFDREIKESDSLIFHEAVAGHDGSILVGDALAREGICGFHITVNGISQAVMPQVLLHGTPVELDKPVPDRAHLVSSLDRGLQPLLKELGFDMAGLVSRDITVQVDSVPKVLHQRNYRLRVNGQEASLDRGLAPNDVVEFEPGMSFQERVRDLLTRADQASMSVKVNGEWVRVPVSNKTVLMNGREVSLDEFLIDGADIATSARETAGLSLGQVMKHLDLDTRAFYNGSLRASIDGRPADAKARVLDGAEISLEVTGRHE
jgi:hypothetical protein